MPKGRHQLRAHITPALDHPDLPELARTVLTELNSRIQALDIEILSQDRRIETYARDNVLAKRTDRLSTWIQSLIARRGYKKAIVALAAKNARIAWAVLSSGKPYAPKNCTQTSAAQ